MKKTFQIIETFDDFLLQRDKRINLLYGGAGSGKSYSIAQTLILRLYDEDDVRMLVIRKTLPALRITAYRLIIDILNQYNFPYKINKSDMVISNGNSEILFKSLDDPEKIKSYEANYVWIEEATEIAYQDFMQLNLRTRRRNEDNINQIYMSFNPISRYHWLNMELIERKREDLAIHHSTYMDNPFLSLEYIAELKALIEQDENFYKIYTLGKFGELHNVIYNNYVVEDFKSGGGDTFFGLDFGYNNQTGLVEVRENDNEFYLTELIYQTKLTNTDLIELLKKQVDVTATIYADSAEPARIEEIARAGFNIKPAEKNVIDGIDYIKAHRLHISSNSANLIDEIRAYKYKEDKNGIVKEEPVKFRDHLLDAARYAIYSAREKRGPSASANMMTPKNSPEIPGFRSAAIPHF
jgi:phage terminase large subunit